MAAASTESGLPYNNVTALMQDVNGTEWAGTGLYDGGGAARLQPEESSWSLAWVTTEKDGLAGEEVRPIFHDRQRVIWFGSEYDGLARWDGADWRVFTEADGLAAAEVNTMVQDADGNLWLGTVDGVTRISAEALDDTRGEPIRLYSSWLG